jgi:hypothetical protein
MEKNAIARRAGVNVSEKGIDDLWRLYGYVLIIALMPQITR